MTTTPEQPFAKLDICLVCNGTIQHTGKTATGWEHETPVPFFDHDAEPYAEEPK